MCIIWWIQFKLCVCYSESLSPELVAAASAAASTLPHASQAKSELLRQLRKHEAVSQEQRKGEAQDIE